MTKGGYIQIGNELELISRDYPDITIEHINQCSFNAKKSRKYKKNISM